MDSLINWIVIGSIIDIFLNGIIWFIIVMCFLPLIEVSDKWTRKFILYMDKVDKWIREILDISFDWIQKKNLSILFAFIFIIILGTLAQFEIIPKILR